MLWPHVACYVSPHSAPAATRTSPQSTKKSPGQGGPGLDVFLSQSALSHEVKQLVLAQTEDFKRKASNEASNQGSSNSA